MNDFPEELQGDIATHLHKEILSLPIFEEASAGCVKSIAMHIKTMFCAPGEYVVHKGDAIHYIYFVCNGSLEILKEGQVVAILGRWQCLRYVYFFLFSTFCMQQVTGEEK